MGDDVNLKEKCKSSSYRRLDIEFCMIYLNSSVCVLCSQAGEEVGSVPPS